MHINFEQADLPVADLGPAADRKLLDDTAQDVGQGQEGEHAVIPRDLNLLLVHIGVQRGHGRHDVLVRQHNTLGIACTGASCCHPPPPHPLNTSQSRELSLYEAKAASEAARMQKAALGKVLFRAHK